MTLKTNYQWPDDKGKFGDYGGKFVPETLIPALAELEPDSDELLPAMRWLAAQAPEEGDFWSTETVARRLYCLARHGRSREFKRVIHADVQFLVNAQFEGGGWSERSATELDAMSPAA